MGKGSKKRPTDEAKFRDGWDRVFGQKSAPLGVPENPPQKKDSVVSYEFGVEKIKQNRQKEIERLRKLLNDE